MTAGDSEEDLNAFGDAVGDATVGLDWGSSLERARMKGGGDFGAGVVVSEG